MAVIQKYLGWVQRFFYQVESQPPPMQASDLVVPVLEISQDWPLQPTTLNRDYATIVGTQAVEIYAPAEGKHGLVTFLTLQPAVALPVADIIILSWDRNPSAPPGVALAAFGGLATTFVPLIGSSSVFALGQPSLQPVYVPPGFRLVLAHTSAVGAAAIVARAQVYERDKFLPLRLP